MLKAGLVGAGVMGTMHSNCYRVLPDVDLVAVADILPEKGKEVTKGMDTKVYSSFEEMISNEELDIIDVCLPTYLHAEYSIKAAEAGKHVICEKPMALNVDECTKMIEAAEKAGVKFMIAHCIRFWPEYKKLKELIDSGRIGPVISSHFCRISPTPEWSWDNWLMDPKRSGGALLDLHIHDVDYLNYLFGMPAYVNSVGRHDDRGWSHAFTQYGYKDLACITEGGWDMPPKYSFEMSFRVIGKDATVEWSTTNDKGLMLYPQTGEGNPEKIEVDSPSVGLDAKVGNLSDLGGYFNELQYFVNCIKEDTDPKIVTAEDARNSVKLILCEEESLKTGKTVIV